MVIRSQILLSPLFPPSPCSPRLSHAETTFFKKVRECREEELSAWSKEDSTADRQGAYLSSAFKYVVS